MASVFFWSVLFSAASVASIVLLGSRDLISGTLTIDRIVRLLFDWRFVVGAGLGFAGRMFFIMTNNALLKIPALAPSSTTITALINSAAIVFVIVANYFFLHEKLNTLQGIGAFLILLGLFLVVKPA